MPSMLRTFCPPSKSTRFVRNSSSPRIFSVSQVRSLSNNPKSKSQQRNEPPNPNSRKDKQQFSPPRKPLSKYVWRIIGPSSHTMMRYAKNKCEQRISMFWGLAFNAPMNTFSFLMIFVVLFFAIEMDIRNWLHEKRDRHGKKERSRFYNGAGNEVGEGEFMWMGKPSNGEYGGRKG
ncbi:hypothetical protein HYALB_00003047 [Hymenoscyphus albidus]|uniref:Uncharacterized protein n=1 Tax=Hymenoscyphus albidus TaxID=595503 RepID=A0A9N9LZJ9_9HELO|nr:hypothetical protein HYALB_00003047 [Hymenoscyphus albidus]